MPRQPKEKTDVPRVSKTWGPNTLNNYTEEDCITVAGWESLCSRMIAGFEVGEENTPHIQFTMTFKKAMTLGMLKKLHPRVHWELTRLEDNAFKYAGKDEDLLVNKGSQQGKRTDITNAYDAAKKGLSVAEFMACEPNFQAIRVFEKAKLHIGPRGTNEPKEVIWLYGKTGTGKSRWAWENYPDLYEKATFKWWDGYDGQETVLIDDFRADYCKFHELLKLLDRYKYRGEIKGGTVEVTAKRFIITAPHHPSETYGYRTDEDIQQLLRRITEIRETVTVTEVGGNTMPRLFTDEEIMDML